MKYFCLLFGLFGIFISGTVLAAVNSTALTSCPSGYTQVTEQYLTTAAKTSECKIKITVPASSCLSGVSNPDCSMIAFPGQVFSDTPGVYEFTVACPLSK